MKRNKPPPPADFSGEDEPASTLAEAAAVEVAPESEPDADLEISTPDIETDPEGIFAAEATPDEKPAKAAKTFEPLTAVITELKTSTAVQETPRKAPGKRLVKAPAPAAPPPSGRWAYGLAAGISVIWVALLGAFFSGYVYDIKPLTLEPVAMTVVGIIAAGMIAVFWAVAYTASQGARLAAEARTSRAQAMDMMEPASLASRETSRAVTLVRNEIESAVTAAAQARHELTTLREVLAAETAQLVEAAASAARTAAALTQSIGDERRALESLSGDLGRQVESTAEAIARQARMVAEASDLAETQLREAEATLNARTGDLAAAAAETTQAAQTAGDDLSRQATRLETAGTFVIEQVRSVEETLAEQRAAIVSVSHQLREDQEDFAAQIETQQAQLTEVLDQLRHGAADLSISANASGESLRDLVSATAEQFRDVAEAAAEERDLFGASTLKSIGAISEAARHERETFSAEAQRTLESLARSAAEARAATEAQAESARQRIDALSHAADMAGQKADASFEARFSEAQALIDQSVSLVEDAGRRAGSRLVEGLDAARATIHQLEGLLREVDARASNMPAEARARSAEVKAAVEQGVEELLDTARKAAEETQAIDAAFHERVRRNYEMLSEAVRLMGAVGGGAPSPRPARTLPPRMPDLAQPAPPPVTDTGERPRLRLRPSSIDAVAEPAPAPPSEEPPVHPARSEEDGWTWRELLSSVDGGSPKAKVDPERGFLDEITGLGIDPEALLPQSRLDEIAPVLQAGDHGGAREIVRRLAPVAMRRLSRSILTVPSMRDQAAAFKTSFEAQLDEAATKDREGFAIGVLLATAEGRAFLLVDAAVGETT